MNAILKPTVITYTITLENCPALTADEIRKRKSRLAEFEIQVQRLVADLDQLGATR